MTRKLEFRRETPVHSLARLTRSSLQKEIPAASRKPAALGSVYYDTKKLRHRKGSLLLHLRRIDRGHAPTMMRDSGERAALFGGSEWEHDDGGRQSDLDAAGAIELEAVKAAPVALAPDTTGQAGFQAIGRACLRQLVANQPVMLGGDPEGLHQMRVALRRLRSAISLFGDMLVDARTQEMKIQFKWISGELGPARDLDVFLERVAKSTEEESNGPIAAMLVEDLRQWRAEAFARARTAVGSARFRGLVADTAAWIEFGGWTQSTGDRASALRDKPIAAMAADELGRRWRKLLRRGARLDGLDPQHQHELRIRAKKLRYASEFFADAFPGKKVKRRREHLLTRLEKLQDALGELNDIAVQAGLTEQVMGTKSKSKRGGAKKTSAAGRISGREEARIASALTEAERAYRALAKAEPFWA
jgi:CHAD domain-containing protein